MGAIKYFSVLFGQVLLILLVMACSGNSGSKTLTSNDKRSNLTEVIHHRLFDSIKSYDANILDHSIKSKKPLFIVEVSTVLDKTNVQIWVTDYLPEILDNRTFNGMLFCDRYDIVVIDTRINRREFIYSEKDLNIDTLDSFLPKSIENDGCSYSYAEMEFDW